MAIGVLEKFSWLEQRTTSEGGTVRGIGTCRGGARTLTTFNHTVDNVHFDRLGFVVVSTAADVRARINMLTMRPQVFALV